MERRSCLVRLKLSAWCALLFGLIASFTLFFSLCHGQQETEHDRFERRAHFRVAMVKDGMNNAIEALRVVNQLFVTSDSVSREQFHSFTEPLCLRYPYIEAFGYHRLISGSERPAYEMQMQRQYPGFAIVDMLDGKRVVAAEKERYRVVSYVEPMAKNEAVFGLDAASLPFQDQAIRRARETGLPSATGLFTFYQGTGSQRGFHLIKALYKPAAALDNVAKREQAVTGYTVVMLRAGDLFEKILTSEKIFANIGLEMRVYAADTADESKRVYGPPASTERSSFRLESLFGHHQEALFQSFELAGAQWHLSIEAQATPFLATHASSLFALVMGLIMTAAATAFLQSIELRAQRVQRLVAQRTEELHQVNAILLQDIQTRAQLEQALMASEERLRKLAGHLELVREDERKRIARDIHDDLGQNLLALRIDVSMMAMRPHTIMVTQERINAALNQIDTTIRAVRTIINDLRPVVLDLGLHAAVEWQAREFERRSGIVCELQIDHDEFALDDKQATALFRIVQESLTNISRHSKASHVHIEMQRRDGGLFLTIADDGVGLAPDRERNLNAFGLVGIEERIHSLGGTFFTANNPGQGMAIMLSVPL